MDGRLARRHPPCRRAKRVPRSLDRGRGWRDDAPSDQLRAKRNPDGSGDSAGELHRVAPELGQSGRLKDE
jgi:hypothetical protein